MGEDILVGAIYFVMTAMCVAVGVGILSLAWRIACWAIGG